MEENENQNTSRKTRQDLALFKAFLSQKTKSEPEELTPKQLDSHLQEFVLGVRKQDGSNYEPASLRSIIASIERFLKKKNYGYSIINSVEFSGCRDVLKAKQKQLKSSGKGGKPNAARSITEHEMKELYRKNQLGNGTPKAMLNTLWLNNTMHFGMRGGKEHRGLCWGDILLKKDETGELEYLEYTERQTKTRTGENPRDVRPVKPRMYESQNKERCPVKLYKEFALKRPEECNTADSPFYIAVNNVKERTTKQAWFKKTPVGINKLYSLMKTMVNNAELPKKDNLTNHSARKTMLQKLNDNGIPPNQIMQISGHKNIQSINNYSSLNSSQLQQISTIISSETQTKELCVEKKSQLVVSSNIGDISPLSTESCNAPSIFSNATISGSNIEININNAQPAVTAKRKRYVIESSDSSQE